MAELLTFIAAFLGGFLSFSGIFISQSTQRRREQKQWYEDILFKGYESVQEACSRLKGHASVLEQRIAFYRLTELHPDRLLESLELHVQQVQQDISQDSAYLESRVRVYRERMMIARSELEHSTLDRSLDLLHHAEQAVGEIELKLRLLHAESDLPGFARRCEQVSLDLSQMSRQLLEMVREDLWHPRGITPRGPTTDQTYSLERSGIQRVDM